MGETEQAHPSAAEEAASEAVDDEQAVLLAAQHISNEAFRTRQAHFSAEDTMALTDGTKKSEPTAAKVAVTNELETKEEPVPSGETKFFVLSNKLEQALPFATECAWEITDGMEHLESNATSEAAIDTEVAKHTNTLHEQQVQDCLCVAPHKLEQVQAVAAERAVVAVKGVQQVESPAEEQAATDIEPGTQPNSSDEQQLNKSPHDLEQAQPVAAERALIALEGTEPVELLPNLESSKPAGGTGQPKFICRQHVCDAVYDLDQKQSFVAKSASAAMHDNVRPERPAAADVQDYVCSIGRPHHLEEGDTSARGAHHNLLARGEKSVATGQHAPHALLPCKKESAASKRPTEKKLSSATQESGRAVRESDQKQLSHEMLAKRERAKAARLAGLAAYRAKKKDDQQQRRKAACAAQAKRLQQRLEARQIGHETKAKVEVAVAESETPMKREIDAGDVPTAQTTVKQETPPISTTLPSETCSTHQSKRARKQPERLTFTFERKATKLVEAKPKLEGALPEPVLDHILIDPSYLCEPLRDQLECFNCAKSDALMTWVVALDSAVDIVQLQCTRCKCAVAEMPVSKPLPDPATTIEYVRTRGVSSTEAATRAVLDAYDYGVEAWKHARNVSVL